MLALPKELNPEQRAALVRGYAEAVTQGRAPWLAAFHDQGKDVDNPHCHLVIRDRDPETGKRVIQLSEKGSTQRLRELWETHANQALENALRPERIDRRTLREQGIRRRPTIHEGVRGRRLARAGRLGRSRERIGRNAAMAKSRGRTVRYPEIDQGLSRSAYNAKISAEAENWAEIDAWKREEEFKVLRAIHNPPEYNEEEAQKAQANEWWLKRKMKKKRNIPR